MIIQKLRLERGWSALAAVFDTDFPTLRGALTMNDGTNNLPTATKTQPASDLQLSEQEKQAYKQVRKLRKFYKDLLIFALIIVFLTIVNGLTSPDYWWVIWVFLGWGLSFVIRAVDLFVNVPVFGAAWEKKQVDKYLKK
ncbi:MAG: XRE family transcriptional regulator [Gammaproteobacteria bacterium]|nr:MAG: XRE family transcriptional regulator [Gammaproteobacteria bacterium]